MAFRQIRVDAQCQSGLTLRAVDVLALIQQCLREARVRECGLGVELENLLVQRYHLVQVLGTDGLLLVVSSEHHQVGHRSLVLRAREFLRVDLRKNLPGGRERDFLLNREQVARLAVVSLRPELCVVGPIDQSHDDSQRIPVLAKTALYHRCNTQLLRDQRRGFVLPSKYDRGRARDDAQTLHAAQLIAQLVGETLAEIRVRFLGASVLERQHHEPLLFGGRRWAVPLANDLWSPGQQCREDQRNGRGLRRA